MALLEFSVIIEVPDSEVITHEDIEYEEGSYDKILSDMEHIAGKDYSIDNSEWNYL